MPLRYTNAIPERDPDPPEEEIDLCPHCGEPVDYCECYFCSRCGELEENCECERCENCGQLMDECYCERCENCHNLIRYCTCDPEEDHGIEPVGEDFHLPPERRTHVADIFANIAPLQWYTVDATNWTAEQRRIQWRRDEEDRIRRERENYGSGFTIFSGSTTVSKTPKHFHPNVLETLEPYVKYELKTAAHPMLTPAGVEEVRMFLSRRYDVRWSYTDVSEILGLEENVQNFTWTWNGEEHKVGGKFINRLAKTFHIRYRISVSERDKNDLNALIQDHWVGGEAFWIDRPLSIDWEAGKFGEKKSEEGSCWWYGGGLRDSTSRVSRFSARMPDLTGAIRLWLKQGEDFYGVGRVWTIRTRAGFPILFNGYGLTTMQWAAKLSKHFKVEKYRQVMLGVDPDMIINNHIGIAFDYLDDHIRTSYNFHLQRDGE